MICRHCKREVDTQADHYYLDWLCEDRPNAEDIAYRAEVIAEAEIDDNEEN